MDPFAGLADFVLGRLKQSAMALWWRLIFELLASMVGSFLVICGLGLMSSGMVAGSIGAGMLAAALSLVILLRREQSKLLKGMTFVFPAVEASKELQTDVQILYKSDNTKEK
jgi:hypothetical protein